MITTEKPGGVQSFFRNGIVTGSLVLTLSLCVSGAADSFLSFVGAGGVLTVFMRFMALMTITLHIAFFTSWIWAACSTLLYKAFLYVADRSDVVQNRSHRTLAGGIAGAICSPTNIASIFVFVSVPDLRTSALLIVPAFCAGAVAGFTDPPDRQARHKRGRTRGELTQERR